MEKITEWDENVGIDWCKEGRMKINKVIRKYNNWIDNHLNDEVKTAKLLVKIVKHLNMHYSNQDGGSGYKEELLKMKDSIITMRYKKYETYK